MGRDGLGAPLVLGFLVRSSGLSSDGGAGGAVEELGLVAVERFAVLRLPPIDHGATSLPAPTASSPDLVAKKSTTNLLLDTLAGSTISPWQ